MEFSANFNMDEKYFLESYRAWLSNVSRFRKWELHIGVFWVALASVLFIYNSSLFSFLVLIFGLLHFVDYYLNRYKWLRDRIKARAENSSTAVSIVANESGIYHKGPTSEGTINWNGIKCTIPTESGLILKIGDGMTIYVPNLSMVDEGFKDFVVNKSA